MNNPIAMTRRQLLRDTGLGLGTAALATLLAQDGRAEALSGAKDLLPRAAQLPAHAKSVILLFQNGGPSQMDLFDPKPELTRANGQSIRGGAVAFGSPFKFDKHGKSGIEVSELFAKLGEHVDDMAIIRSMHADVPNHEPSLPN